MTSRSGRPYAGAADLRRMEAALAHAYSSTSLRVGDLSWLSREHTHRELSLDIRLWDDGEGPLAHCWLAKAEADHGGAILRRRAPAHAPAAGAAVAKE